MNYGVASQEQLEKIDEILTEKLIKIGVDCVIIIDMAGNIITAKDNGTSKYDVYSFAALAKASSPPAPGLPPAPADGQGGEPTAEAVQAPNIQALVADGDAMLALLETEGPAAIRALAVGLEPDQSPEAQQAMVDQLEDLTMVGLLVAIKHFVVVNAGFFAAQGLRLPQGGLLGAPMAPTDADRARAGAAAAAQRPGATRPRKR